MSHRAPRTADNDLRAALGQLIGRPSTEEDWRLASLGVAAGGLGARCAAERAPAAYVAIFSACRELCGRLWPAFDPFDLDDGCRSVAAEDALRGTISCGANIYAVSDSPSQKSLSVMVEAQSVSALFGGPTLPKHRRLYLEACRVPGAGAWLTANLSCIDSTFLLPFSAWLSSAVFGYRCGIAARLEACAGKFSTAGERTSTPTPLLLLPRPLLLVAALPMSGFPGVSGFAEAWDFPVSSLLRSPHLSSAFPSVPDVFHEVETRKLAFQDTASLVAERGATFCPLVLEACGLPLSPAWPAAPLPDFPRTLVSGLHSALAAPSSGLAGDLVPSSSW